MRNDFRNSGIWIVCLLQNQMPGGSYTCGKKRFSGSQKAQICLYKMAGLLHEQLDAMK
jgi:hypothetical protein